MKLTKKLEAEILNAYKEVFDANLRGDMRTFASILDDNCHIFGTAASEVFKNKKAAVKFYTATAGQVTGKVKLRNRKISVMAIDNDVMVNEQADFYILIDDQWTFYNPCRISGLFHKKNNQWKAIHMHGSFPDSKTEEGEQVNTDKIKAENIRLRDAVKRRTIELENKNRELEIEASLERVRTVAMGMKQPKDMIDVCRTISKQLQLLKIKNIRNVQTAIINDEKGTYLNYEYFTQYKTTSVLEIVTKLHPKVQEFANTIKKSPDAFFTTSFKGAALRKWRDYRKKTGQNADPILDKAKSLHYYFYSIGPGALGLSTYAALNEEEINIFNRFRNVFSLAYKRFTDIQKAEAQAREAQIEASLEKVRAQALGMRKSEDLPNVCQVLFKELKKLSFGELRNAMVNIHNDEKRTFTNYDYSDEIGKSITPLFYDIHPLIKKQIKQIRSADNAFSETVFKGADLKKWKEFRKSRGEKEDKRIKNSTALYYYFYSIGTGSIGISTFNAISEEKQELLKRFRNVFAFAYRRYMDVAQAEAQAKEAKIELGLERVRARAMAMQNSAELAELVSVLFKELTQLDFSLTSCIIWISDTQTLANTLWVTSSEMNKPAKPVRLKPFQHSFFHSIIHAWKEKDPKWIYSLTGKEKTSFEKAFFANEPSMPVALKKALAVPKQVVFSASFNNFGALEILGTEPLNEEKFEILHRFGKVFDSSYTRFNDLQKAEAQAREAQIELALERVRARAMAMQNSDELSGLVATLFEELTKLDLILYRCIIWIFNPDTLAARMWMANSEDKENAKNYLIKKLDHPYYNSILKAWKEKKTKWVYELQGKDKRSIDKLLLTETELAQLPDAVKKGIISSKHTIVSGSFNNFGLIEASGPVQQSEEQLEILSRFGKVFDSSYTRFNDLKKAEAQTREAQIEVAVERVRSKALAMHRSEDLHSVVVALKKELMGLRIPDITAATIYLAQNDGSIRVLDLSDTAEEDDDKPQLQLDKVFRLEDTDPDLWIRRMWNRKENYFVVEADENDFVRAVEWIRTVDPAGADLAEKIIREKSIKKAWLPTVKLEKGVMNIDLLAPPAPEIENILLKIGAGFDLAYKRFLDLQKAEAQTREAQIEVAVERVRAKALAMHQSGEIMGIAVTMRKELQSLNIPGFDAVTITLRQDDGTIRLWDNTSAKQHEDGTWENTEWIFRLEENNPDFYINRIWDSDKKYFVEEQDENDLLITIDMVRKFDRTMADVVEHHFKEKGIKHAWHPAVQLTHGRLNLDFYGAPEPEVETILLKMGAAFDLAYKRFLDLQKAEAQTREAQIEAALERTRTQSMIMQHSKELDDTLRVFHQQVLLLGINSAFSFLWLPDEKNDRHIFWAAWGENKNGSTVFKSKAINYPLDTNEPATAQCLVDWKSNEPVYSYHVPPAAVENYFAVWQELIDGVEHLKPEYFSGGLHYVEAFMKYGCFGVMVAADLREDEKMILSRFANEFERTYTRFLDLQKAEAQAREAEIQLALERVRARSLAMHHTSELQDIVNIVAQQLYHIGMDINGGVLITINDEVDEALPLWSSAGAADYVQKVVVPFLGKPIFTDLRDAIKRRNNFFANEYSKEEKDEMFDHLFRYAPWSSSAEERKKELLSRKGGLTRSAAISQYTSIAITNHNGKKFSEEEHEILKRFGNVFEQSYTRFLDLQKAEAQAREAQIETALERVRSRTMAMQHSDELPDAAINLFEQVQALGIPVWAAGYCIWDEDKQGITLWMSSEGVMQASIHAPLTEDPSFIHMKEAYERGDDFYVEGVGGEALVKHYQYVRSLPVAGEILDSIISAGHPVPTFQIFHCVYFSQGFLLFTTYEAVPEAYDIFKRFGKVFDQTYTRFLDLQKAEAQTREAQIETALERVRSRTMGMQHSDELGEVAAELFTQMNNLVTNLWTCGFVLCEKDRDEDEWWLSMDTGFTRGFFLPNVGDYAHSTLYNGWEKGDAFRAVQLEGKDLQQHYDWLMELPVARSIFEEMDNAGLERPDWQKLHAAYFSKGYLVLITREPCGEEEIFKRFAQVFDQTYTRFLDLQKAEAQAREAEIELSLERVRARTMAMQKSQELKEVIQVVYEQFVHLNIHIEHTGFIIDYKATDDMHIWLADQHEIPTQVTVPYFDSAHWNSFRKAKEEGIDFFANLLNFEEKNKFYQDLFKLVSGVPEKAKEYYFSSPGLAISTVLLENVGLYIENFSGIPYTDEENKTLMRFGKVFQQTYTRFLDLQKAEAQTREAQINLAVERVRARALAMFKSEEILQVVHKLKEEIMGLDIPNVIAATIHLKEKDGRCRIWDISSIEINDEALHHPMDIRFNLEETDPDFFMRRIWGNTSRYFIEMQDEADFKRTIQWLRDNDRNQQADETEQFIKETGINKLYHPTSQLNNGRMCIDLLDAPAPEIGSILEKMGAAFDLAYKRFEDLQNSEAQSREAQIELALEKVRSKAMAMHNSDELSEVLSVLFNQFDVLGISPMYTFLSLIDLKKNSFTYRQTGRGGKRVIAQQIIDLDAMDVWKEVVERWKAAKYDVVETMYVPKELVAEVFGLYRETYSALPEDAKIYPEDFPDGMYATIAASKFGHLGYDHLRPSTQEEKSILLRFNTEFVRLYQRFLDLQKAEAQAREAQIETALERVRSRTMAMQKSEELPDAANVLFLQVQSLGIPAWSCGYNILAADKKSSTCIMSSEGEIQVPFVLPLTEHWSLLPWYEAIQNNLDFFVYGQGGEDLIEHYRYLASVPGLENVFQQFENAGISLPTNQINHLVRFTNGFLLFITYESVPDAHDIFIRFGKVFEQTYTRFLDLQLKEEQALRLREEKTKLEQTLGELQATQKQLIQTEKMASLGELTAGIAHEIQNPLNFVNNFSEVSNELIQEMMEEVEKGNYDLAKEIAEDVKLNLEKINNHGKRADAIVKGMLQHSRSSSGTKEPTDINALCDEYLRLSYHGLRAKDKSFNAKFETSFDETVGKINVMPQDIGRVILNLINNAFYAVDEKKKQNRNGYDPTIAVTTKNLDDRIEITVKDNGNGIPQKVLDKIFQPFFTTKPTGQGTGLGLSLAYDIMKAHGGDIKVETKEGEGTAFIISLPVN